MSILYLNLEKTTKLLKKLKKITIREYSLTKEPKKLTFGDIFTHYQEPFKKVPQVLNNQFGLKIKYPLSIVAIKNF